MFYASRKRYISFVSIYTLVMCLWILSEDKGSETLYCYHHRSELFNKLFILITKLGEWVSLLLLGLYIGYRNRKWLLITAIVYLSLEGVLSITKKLLNAPRPLSFFRFNEISPVPDYAILLHHSMPSGHTFSAFFVACFISSHFLYRSNLQLIILMLAVLVGLSRIYLMCHFKEDVFAGSLMGIFGGTFSSYLIHKYNHHAH